MVTAQGSRGDIILFEDFVGAEIPVASAVAYAGNVTGYKIGRFKVTGDLVETDTGAISVAVSNGALRISGNNENGKGVAIGTEVIFDPALNGMLSMETRVQRAVVTASIFHKLSLNIRNLEGMKNDKNRIAVRRWLCGVTPNIGYHVTKYASGKSRTCTRGRIREAVHNSNAV